MIAQLGGSDSDDSSSSDEEDDEVENLCLMARETNEDEVISNSSHDNLLDQYNELQDVFDELFDEHKALLLKYEALKVNCNNHVDKNDFEKIKSDFNKVNDEKEALIQDKTLLEVKVSDLTCSLDKFTQGTKLLDNLITPKRAPNDKSGIGFDNFAKFGAPPKYNRVAYNYNTNRHGRFQNKRPNTYSHAHYFERKNNNKTYNYFSPCMHCSLSTHNSLHCPNRFRVNARKYRWVVKTRNANPLGPKFT